MPCLCFFDPIHTSTLAQFGPVRHVKISNVNVPLIKPNQLTGLGKKLSNILAYGVKMLFSNNWKGGGGTAWFIGKLPVTLAKLAT